MSADAVASAAGADSRDMEGWLYLIRSNKIGLQYSRRRYFVLKDHVLKSFKYIPVDNEEVPVRSAPIDTCVRVTDNGRENIRRKVLFIFTLYNTANHNDRLKLGSDSSEKAAKWIRSLQVAAAKEPPNPATNFVSCSKRKWPSIRIWPHSRKSSGKLSSDWTVSSSTRAEAVTQDVIAPSSWKIFGCQNGLRLFKEASEWDSRGGHWDDHPAIMAVGVIDGTSAAIFQTLMSLGPSRSEWDFCFFRGSVIEHIDGHTDIIRKQLYRDWLPWGMKRRDLLLQRYWRREDDGSYVILYHSVLHKKCPPQKGYVRANLKSGGYVITPINHGKHSQVKHMLSMDWKLWKMSLRPAATRSMTIQMLERVAALREMFKSKAGNYSGEFSSGEMVKDIGMSRTMRETIKPEVPDQENLSLVPEVIISENDSAKPPSELASLMGLSDAFDEFFDVPEPVEYGPENDQSMESHTELLSLDDCQPIKSPAAALVQRLHDLATQKQGYMDLQELAWEESTASCAYGATLQNDPSCSTPCSWSVADPSTFLIRGENYLRDHSKIKVQSTVMQLVGADWLRSDKREDDLSGRPGGIVQRYALQGAPEFFFVVNIQVPGSNMYNVAMYYALKTPLEEHPLLHRFVNGDDAFRNSRFKLIPYISKGSWIVKQSVGKKACLVGQALEMNYFRGKNYLEIGIDVGSSAVARGVVSLVLGYLNNLVVEMAFVIQGNTPEELPEFVLGTCRLNHMDAAKTVPVRG
ncbi:hypothetical protein MLD38_002569 [Melastoma candidum]|uniref:Uncharacterized protein n=1 Tax=Melastoma candidum TaxID=119954 RepID=A0ACB9RZ65_9MYRT|nr:hypothetical protein MLD38_002569 [Melastoma candidum]